MRPTTKNLGRKAQFIAFAPSYATAVNQYVSINVRCYLFPIPRAEPETAKLIFSVNGAQNRIQAYKLVLYIRFSLLEFTVVLVSGA